MVKEHAIRTRHIAIGMLLGGKLKETWPLNLVQIFVQYIGGGLVIH